MLAERVKDWSRAWKQEGREEGRQEGLKEGQKKGEATMLRRLLELRFGPLAEADLANTLERLNQEVKRRAHGVGIFPNEASIRRLIGAVLMEQNEEWQLQHRYLPQHTMLETVAGTSDLTPLPAD